jgi:lysophospholipase L1-like esterase
LIPLHQAYVEVVRETAAESGAPLCDLAARAEALPWAQRTALFSGDGIHLSPQGDAAVAQWLFECLEHEELWPILAASPG